MLNKVVIISTSTVLIALLSLFFISHNSYAGWSAYSRITPENIHEQRFKFTFNKVKFSKQFKLTLDDHYVGNGKEEEFSILKKSAWIVLTKEPLNIAEQNLHRYFGDSSIIYDSEVLFISKLGYTQDSSNKNVLEVVLDKTQLSSAYIYVGYDRPVNDGGLRYTIDLKTFYMDYISKN
ncbi:hypothetical protein [Pseudoalteromonas sp. 1_2015MBL_MicDiv]|uniref:hypothetical protein n=1 Tax=Pseudoalteromonas sp. 1_2015MBL_MicDiv TaxID=1720343 RepID=UPI000BBE0C29|nr:hypothetical protein [Pseudoalteromonas sp. 1_2015MBL_MicDiv]ATG79660.1 hypothetical protein AOR04_19100 [Pseudoalteromonas sp. 1_2015MBL_MicDiv]